MKRAHSKISQADANFKKVTAFLREMDMRASYFLLPTILSIATAFFEGISMALLIPLAKGAITFDFSFVERLPVFKNIIAVLPEKLTSTSASMFVLILVTIFTAVVAKNACSYLAAICAGYQAGKFANHIRTAIFRRYLGFGKLFFDRTSNAFLNSILIDFTMKISQQARAFQSVITAALTIVVYIVILALISWKLTILVLIMYPSIHFSTTFILKKVKTISETHTKQTLWASKKSLDSLGCMTLVKLYNMEKKEDESFGNISNSIRSLELSMVEKGSIAPLLHEIITTLGLLGLVIIVALIVTGGGKALTASFLLFFLFIRRSAGLVGIFNDFRIQLAWMSGPIEKMKEIFSDKDKFYIKGGDREFLGLQDEIEIKNLKFSYIEGTQILNNVNLSIQKGKMTAIVGPTGVGKTTIISLLLRFYECPPSSIFIDGVDIRDYTLKSLRNHMALVSQETALFNDTIRKNITYGREEETSEEDLMDTINKSKLSDFIHSLPDGVDTLIGDMGVRLSGGEKQRIAIARALLKKSEILFLDEATSSLDTHTERLIQEAIEEAVKGRTTVVVAHRLSTIRNADKIVVIENGTIAEQGALRELLEKKGRFYEYWEEQKFF